MIRRPYWPKITLAAKYIAGFVPIGGGLVALHLLHVKVPPDHGAQHLVPLIVIALIAGGVAMAVAAGRWKQKAAEAIQVYRDRRARDILGAIACRQNGAPLPAELIGPYYLYLRAFSSTQIVKIVTESWLQKRGALDPNLIEPVSITGFGVSSVYRRYAVWGDLESLIADRLERSGIPLIGLGAPGEQVGAGRVPSETERWRQDFIDLAEGARGLFVLPAASPGTGWEIDHLVNHPNLLAKSLFLIPPEPSLLGDPRTMGGWFQPGARRADTAFTTDPALDLALLERVLGRDEAAQFLCDLTAPIGASFEESKAGVTEFLRETAMATLAERGVGHLSIPPEGAILVIGPDRTVVSVHTLLGYYSKWSLNPARFNVIRVALVGLEPALSELQGRNAPFVVIDR